MKYLLAILLLVTAIMSASLATAGDHIVSRALLEDKAGNLTIADVVGREFKPTGVSLSKGYTRSVHWLKLY